MGLRVLITNTILSGRTGTEIVVSQLADRFRSLQHEVILYSPQIGELGLALRQRGHLVFDRIANIGLRPDVIHGHHVGPLLTAIASFPGTPAIQVLHSVDAEFDAPLVHPQVVAHYAVSEYIAAQRAAPHVPTIGILGNAVDLETYKYRVRPVRNPPVALSISKNRDETAILEHACQGAGIKLTQIGPAHGRVVADLERYIDEADLVFGSGRSALEAVASGCAVILTDGDRFGGAVTTRTLDRLMALNFGVRAMSSRVSPTAIHSAIEELNWADVSAVSKRVRDVASLDRQAEHLLGIYREIMAKPLDLSTAHRELGSLVEQYVPSHGELPWAKLAQDVATGFLHEILVNAARRQRFPAFDATAEILPRVSVGIHRFGHGQQSAAWLRSGWWELERWGVWSQQNAALSGPLSPDVRSMVLRYRLFGQTPRVELQIGGTGVKLELAAFPADRNGVRTASFVLPVKCLQEAWFELNFAAENAASPSELRMSGDARKLAVGLISLGAFRTRIVWLLLKKIAFLLRSCRISFKLNLGSQRSHRRLASRALPFSRK
jgi:hypothetical protein